MKQTIEIEVPDGKIAVWKDNKVMFKDIEQPKPKYPKTWGEFCNNYPIESNEHLDAINTPINQMSCLVCDHCSVFQKPIKCYCTFHRYSLLDAHRSVCFNFRPLRKE